MGDFWQPTAEMFSSLFEKPKMSEKLLVKPPFKYIFDIIMETTNTTGFARELYSPQELQPDFYQTKENKILFLKKITDLVQMMLNREIPCKPTRVVAGHEPENTNLLLQAVYECAVSGLDSLPFSKKVAKKYLSEVQGGQAIEQEQKQQPPSQQESKKPEQQKQPQQQQQSKQQEQQKLEQQKLEQQKQEQQRQEQQKLEQQKQDQQRQEQLRQEQQRQQQEKQKAEKQQQSKQDEKKKEEPKQQQKQEPVKQTIVQNRPSSALKKPPKLQSNVKVEDNNQQRKEGPQGLIIEGSSKNDEEDFIIDEGKKINLENDQQSKFVREALKQEAPQEKNEDEKGKIRMGRLGAKKSQEVKKKQNEIVSNLIGKDDIETLRNFVQTLCQNTNPLGKSLEFLNDDIESMNKEMEFWKNQYQIYNEKLKNEKKVTEECLQPYYDKISEIDEQIKDQSNQSRNLKATIIKNQSIIQNLLLSVVSSK